MSEEKLIHIVSYHHKYGIDLELFDSEEKAEKYIQELESDSQYDEETEYIEYCTKVMHE